MAAIHIEVNTYDVEDMELVAQGLMNMAKLAAASLVEEGVDTPAPAEAGKPQPSKEWGPIPQGTPPRVVTGTPDPIDISTVNDPTTFKADMPTPELVIGQAPSMPTPATVPPLIPGGANPVTEAIELDTEGLPWDARIHAITRTKRQSDMTWKLKRGVSEELIKSVKDELRTQYTRVETVVVPVPELEPATIARAAAATTPIVPVAPAATQPPVMPGQSEYQVLMQAVSKAIGTGRLTMTDVETACTNAGLDSPQDLAVHLDRVPQVAAALGVELCQS